MKLQRSDHSLLIVLTLIVNACKQAVIGELLANDIESDAESRDAAFLIKEFIAEVVSL